MHRRFLTGACVMLNVQDDHQAYNDLTRTLPATAGTSSLSACTYSA